MRIFEMKNLLFFWLVAFSTSPILVTAQTNVEIEQVVPVELATCWAEWAEQLYGFVVSAENAGDKLPLMSELAYAEIRSGEASAAVETAKAMMKLKGVPPEAVMESLADFARAMHADGQEAAAAQMTGQVALYFLTSQSVIEEETLDQQNKVLNAIDEKYADALEAGDERVVQARKEKVLEFRLLKIVREGKLLASYAAFESWLGDDDTEFTTLAELNSTLTNFSRSVIDDWGFATANRPWLLIAPVVFDKASSAVVQDFAKLAASQVLSLAEIQEAEKFLIHLNKNEAYELYMDGALRSRISVLGDNATFLTTIAQSALEYNRDMESAGLVLKASQVNKIYRASLKYIRSLLTPSMWDLMLLDGDASASFEGWLDYRLSEEANAGEPWTIIDYAKQHDDVAEKFPAGEVLYFGLEPILTLRTAGNWEALSKLLNALAKMIAAQNFEPETVKIAVNRELGIYDDSAYVYLDSTKALYKDSLLAYTLAIAYWEANRIELAEYYLELGDAVLASGNPMAIVEERTNGLRDEAKEIFTAAEASGAMTDEQRTQYQELQRKMNHWKEYASFWQEAKRNQARAYASMGKASDYIELYPDTAETFVSFAKPHWVQATIAKTKFSLEGKSE